MIAYNWSLFIGGDQSGHKILGDLKSSILLFKQNCVSWTLCCETVVNPSSSAFL